MKKQGLKISSYKVVEKLKLNEGQVVTVAGTQVPLVADIPVLGRLFTNRTSEGRRYAVLDEAQYRTMVLSAGKMAPAVPVQENRQVVVGTDNEVGGQKFGLSGSDAGYNRIKVGGEEVVLPHDKYLAVENDERVSIIKAGDIHDCQEKRDISFDLSVPYRIELPQAGVPYYFEKTLLGAGESADIELRM